MNHPLSLMIASAFLWMAAAAPSSAEKLPINIKISFDAYDLIDDFPGGREVLRGKLHPELSAYVIKKLGRVWVLADQPVENVLLLSVEGSAYEESPYIEMRFNDGNHELLEYQGALEVGVPALGDRFADKLGSVLKRAVRSNVGRMRSISEGIRSRWDFGDPTDLHIERLMDAAARRTYSPRMAVLALDGQSPGRVAASDDGLIKQTLYLGPGDEVRGTLRPIRYDSVQTDVAMSARFCLQRRDLTEHDRDSAQVGYHCPIDGDCNTNVVAPEGWAITQCEQQGGFLDRLRQEFTSTAFAAEQTELHWSVPPLEMLYQQSDDERQANTGFTDFTIETDTPLGVEADAVVLEVSSNGVPIWLNSVPPASNQIPIDPGDGLLLRFGLQNLQLADRRDGCEELDARLVFYQQGEPTGDAVELTRLYAPLRHPAERTMQTGVGPIKWWGRYRQPAGQKESGIFLLSSLFHPDEPGAQEAALDRLNSIRADFEAANLSISAQDLGGVVGLVGKPDIRENAETTQLQLVGKIRPPRTVRTNGSIAYGLQLGLRAPNGLLQFTYDWGQAQKLLDILVEARSGNSDLRRIIPARKKDFYVYTYTPKRQIGPDWACDVSRAG